MRRQYENDKYVSTIVTNEFGVIIEMDCQLKNLPKGKERRGIYSERKYIVSVCRGLYWRNKNYDTGKM